MRKEYEETKIRYLKNMDDMSKEEKIQYLEDCKFNIDMIDRWQDDDELCWRVVVDLLKEMKENE